MVSVSISIRTAAVAASVACALVSRANGHGYMLIPESQFDGSANSAWIVQIDPQWSSDDWDGNTQQSVDTYVSLAAENGVSDIRSLLDDTSIYGADCGYTNPDGTAQSIPTDSTATFSRAIQHVGPCEIWLDDTMVFHEDDCYSTYGNEDVDVKSVFPVDYSQCETTGCSEMRFYWLAFQGVDGETVWQVYKDCIPLTGGSGTSTTSTSSTTTSTDETENESDTTTTTSAPSTSTTISSDTTDASSTTATTAPSTSTTASSATTDTSSTTTTTAPSTSSTSDSKSTASTTGTVQPSSNSASSGWGNWGNWGGNSGGFGGFSGGWGGRQLRA